ncbi:Rtf2 RING-finger-domain-containing protein [Sordaria brevicollis]|uniref:Rtf2 RING-finger-domain-containing protein n=1 Tax=Sordaria brevicollis TaxID=83679 RepID=A0AAE0PKX3_SORBR|nr:Rtf2 RING-finger-domain-containing protein [Sordaria brevicollis]
MGNDGGSIPKRRELVKEAARNPTVSELKATIFESLNHAWTHDPISSEPIDLESVVSDWRGRLYNYETILKGLMPGAIDDSETNNTNSDDKTNNAGNGESPTIFATELSFASTGIKSLRDVVKLKFKRYTPPPTGSSKKEKEIFACPVTLKELGASTKSVYLVPCGHVFAEQAIQMITATETSETTTEKEACPECSEPFNKSEDVIPILPTDKADIQRLAKRMEDLKAKGLTHSLKKDKSASKEKKKNKRTADEANANGEEKESKKAKKSAALDSISTRVSGINNPATAALTARVLADQDEAMKRRKLAAAGLR